MQQSHEKKLYLQNLLWLGYTKMWIFALHFSELTQIAFSHKNKLLHTFTQLHTTLCFPITLNPNTIF